MIPDKQVKECLKFFTLIASPLQGSELTWMSQRTHCTHLGIEKHAGGFSDFLSTALFIYLVQRFPLCHGYFAWPHPSVALWAGSKRQNA